MNRCVIMWYPKTILCLPLPCACHVSMWWEGDVMLYSISCSLQKMLHFTHAYIRVFTNFSAATECKGGWSIPFWALFQCSAAFGGRVEMGQILCWHWKRRSSSMYEKMNIIIPADNSYNEQKMFADATRYNSRLHGNAGLPSAAPFALQLSGYFGCVASQQHARLSAASDEPKMFLCVGTYSAAVINNRSWHTSIRRIWIHAKVVSVKGIHAHLIFESALDL